MLVHSLHLMELITAFAMMMRAVQNAQAQTAQQPGYDQAIAFAAALQWLDGGGTGMCFLLVVFGCQFSPIKTLHR